MPLLISTLFYLKKLWNLERNSMNLEQRKALEALIDKEIVELKEIPDHDPRIAGLIVEKITWWQSVRTSLNPPTSYGGYDR